jgi:hypothetical protein
MVWRVASTTLLLAVAAWAQTSGDVQQAVPPRSPFVTSVRAAIAKPSASTKVESNASPQKPAGTEKRTSAPRLAAISKPAVSAVATPSNPDPAKKVSPATAKAVRGSRDPFISPISTASAAAAVCNSGGKRCLVIDKIRLKGVVRSESGYIAVVVNSANRAYFLRENDPLMDGHVVRITRDSVTFKETGKDRMGHTTTRDVTKKLSGPAA